MFLIGKIIVFLVHAKIDFYSKFKSVVSSINTASILIILNIN